MNDYRLVAQAFRGPEVIVDPPIAPQPVLAGKARVRLGWKPRFRGFARNASELFEEWRRGREDR